MKSRTNSTATLEHQEGIESLNQWLRQQTNSNKGNTSRKKQATSIVAETVLDNTSLKTQTHTQLWVECQPTEECKHLIVAATKYGETRSLSLVVSVDSLGASQSCKSQLENCPLR